MATATTFSGSVSSAAINTHTHSIAAPKHGTTATFNVSQKYFNFNQSNQTGPNNGDVRINTDIGGMEVYQDGSWVVVAGIQQKTQIDLIKDQLREFWPEVLFDLMMKDLL